MNLFLRKARRAREIWKTRGYRGIRQHVKLLSYFREQKKLYQELIEKTENSVRDNCELMRREIEKMPHKPLLSVVMPVYNVEEKWLRLCLESVENQIYPHWECCIADDASPAPHIRKILEEYAARDNRFKVVFRRTNGHISAASNSALELATGEFSILLDHDDALHATALYFVAKEINAHPEVEMIYSDEDLIDEENRRYEPKFKPDWSPNFFYSLNLITHLSAYRTELLRELGGFRLGTEGSQDYDLALRVIEKIPARNIRHIPRILYHWRAIQGSVALAMDEKPYAHDRAKQVIKEHFVRAKIPAEVKDGYSCLHRAAYQMPENTTVSVILSAANSGAIENILSKKNDQNIELIAVGDANRKHPRLRFVEEKKSIAQSLNDAAGKATGDVLIFLDADVAPLSGGWLPELVSQASRKEIGAVGGKILNADKTIRNAGVIIGARGAVGFAHYGFPAHGLGNFLRLVLINNFSAVAGAFAVRREIFGRGFDADNFPDGLYEVDFCLRLRERGLLNLFTPYAEFLQTAKSPTEKVLRSETPEVARFKERWKEILSRDPYYNPNLSLADESFSITTSPRLSDF